MRTIRHFCATILLAVALNQSVFAFALFGPDAPWMTASNGFAGQVGGPMNLGEGYRWNVPVLTYAFDQAFLNYFGTNGVAEVEKAIQILNNLPPASAINLNDYPTNAAQIHNFPFPNTNIFYDYSLGTMDLKSMALALLLQEMGLASPYRSMYSLHDFSVQDGVTNYNLVIRNFDPVTLNPSTNLNGTPVSYSIFSLGSALDVFPFGLLSLNFSAADYSDISGGFTFSGLSYDDAGGLRYLLNSNRFAMENLIPGVHGIGTNAANYVTAAMRPGVDKITFQRPPFYNSLTGNFFSPFTNSHVDSYLTNGTLHHQDLERVITRPDILFTTASGFNNYSVTDPSNWVKNALPGVDGPGVIQPPILITLNRLDPGVFNFSGEYPVTSFPYSPVWGSFDPLAPSAAPLSYPVSPQSDFTTFNLTLSPLETPDLFYFNSRPASWILPGPVGNRYLFQTSTNLTDWTTVLGLTNLGRTFSYYDQITTNTPRRFYRTIPQ